MEYTQAHYKTITFTYIFVTNKKIKMRLKDEELFADDEEGGPASPGTLSNDEDSSAPDDGPSIDELYGAGKGQFRRVKLFLKKASTFDYLHYMVYVYMAPMLFISYS